MMIHKARWVASAVLTGGLVSTGTASGDLGEVALRALISKAGGEEIQLP